MFERYNENARRSIFFARYEASQFGSPSIETEHLLLGLLKEAKSLSMRFQLDPNAIRTQIESVTLIRESISTSVDLPLSNESKRVLAYAAEEAEMMAHRHIGAEHLLLGLLREEKCAAAELLRKSGLSLEAARTQIAASGIGGGTGMGRAGGNSPIIEFLEDGIPLSVYPIIFILPRIGEELVLHLDGRPTPFRVENVRFLLEPDQHLLAMDTPHRLEKIQVLLKRAVS